VTAARSYRDVFNATGRRPPLPSDLRTVKKPGELVMTTAHEAAWRVPGPREARS
jgi:hypothetical protein